MKEDDSSMGSGAGLAEIPKAGSVCDIACLVATPSSCARPRFDKKNLSCAMRTRTPLKAMGSRFGALAEEEYDKIAPVREPFERGGLGWFSAP